MAIKIDRKGPVSIKVYDSRYDDDATYLTIDLAKGRTWAVRRVVGMVAGDVSHYGTAKEALSAAAKELEQGISELETAVKDFEATEV